MINLTQSLVRGFNYQGRMSNGARFSFWSPSLLKRSNAIVVLLRTANGDYEEVYTKNDIESYWFNENKRR